MIGRGIFSNPFAFEKEKKDHSSKELLDLLRLHLDLHDKYSHFMSKIAVTPAATNSTYISTSWKCFKNFFHVGSFSASDNSFTKAGLELKYSRTAFQHNV